MKLASKVFKAMLSGPFKEGETLAATGNTEISLPEDDPVAFEVIMNIIHNRSKAIPRKMTLESLVAVAVLTDKYEFQQVVEMVSDIWLQTLTPKAISKMVTPELFSWLSVVWTFRRPVEFALLTKDIVLNSAWDEESKPYLKETAGGYALLPERLIGKK